MYVFFKVHAYTKSKIKRSGFSCKRVTHHVFFSPQPQCLPQVVPNNTRTKSNSVGFKRCVEITVLKNLPLEVSNQSSQMSQQVVYGLLQAAVE